MLSPITLYCFLPYGLSITFIVLVAVSSSFIFSTPPYNFGPEQSGYIWFAPFVAALIATLIAGKLSDVIVSKAVVPPAWYRVVDVPHMTVKRYRPSQPWYLRARIPTPITYPFYALLRVRISWIWHGRPESRSLVGTCYFVWLDWFRRYFRLGVGFSLSCRFFW